MSEAKDTQATTQSIVVDYDFTQPPRKVWRALTEPAILATWLMPNDIAAVVGHRFTFQAQPMPGWDGVVQCEVLEVVPEQRLVYSWRGGPESNRLDTTVTWTLASTATGTRLRLEHAGFKAKDAFALDGMGRGWRGKIAERVVQIVNAME
jgi:uncharacterized protein YndB with AHSA1/START domain